MSLVLDIGQGAGLAGATGVRPFLPPLLAGALARGDIGHRLRRHGLAVPGEPGLPAGGLALAVLCVRGRTFGGEPAARCAWATAVAGRGARARCCSPARWPRAATRPCRACRRGARAPLLASLAVAACWSGPRGAWTTGAAGLLTVYADVAALVLAAIAIFVRAGGLPRAGGLRAAAGARQREQGDRKYAGPADPAVSTRRASSCWR